ncbi:HAD hydrolase-like protein [Bordetella genomosp. 5]|uniref:HAD family hydrolase n=1 Tax=Bordetella genomosp. 5 TaxID=1395608 RepID=A0A261SZG8_9BORD|nr:HAD hydrolase-like protein [Bordetella genomosp. 5]OZI42756.1 HAD family hydrolase [Bordetella genomosp. 5]
MKYPLIAFDFDGTLADTLPWFESILDDVAERYGFRKTTATERRALRRQGVQEILKFLGIPLWKAPAILIHVRERMNEAGPQIPLFDGVADALTQLRARGVKLAVVSSNATENVQRVLGPEISALFDDFECGTDLFGKAAKLERLMQRHGVTPAQTALVGDEVRDVEAARKAGVASVAVSWGYNDAEALRAERPDALLASVGELGTHLS